MAGLILASGSKARRKLLEEAGAEFGVVVPRIDEESITESLLADGGTPKEVAEVLAEYKAAKVSARHPEPLVIGCDQVLEFSGSALGKCGSLEEAADILRMLRGKSHCLHSAAVVYEGGRPVWRHTGTAKLRMKDFGDEWLAEYVRMKGDRILASVGCYEIEDEQFDLVSLVQGSYEVVLGIPLNNVLAYLGDRGMM